MKLIATIFFLSATLIRAASADSQPFEYSFYARLGSGLSCSESANICAPYPPWNPAVQGYNAGLGRCPIAALSIGCELSQMLDLEFNVANRSIFKYRKFQTPTAGGGSYSRTFDLNVTSILFSAYLLGRGVSCLSRELCCGSIYPLIGFGLGASDILITNYRTICLPATGDSTPYASFSAENQYTLSRKVSYSLFIGLEYNHDARWAIATGYRWFNAGSFNGPQYQRIASGSAVDVGGAAWHMRLRANEWFIECKIFI